MAEIKKPVVVIGENAGPDDPQTPDPQPAEPIVEPIVEPTPADAQVCAGCGETVVFDKSQSVGGRESIQYHGCEQMEATLHQYWLDTINEPNTPVPATVA